jgi:hypothetical protein
MRLPLAKIATKAKRGRPCFCKVCRAYRDLGLQPREQLCLRVNGARRAAG